MPDIATRLSVVHESIATAAARAGRSVDEIELLAVSKTQPPEAVMEALEAGQTLFGENRVQEARAKIPLVPSRARWHLVGHLQKNKIRHALALDFALIQSIDSVELAREVNRVAAEEGARPHVLLEVNVAGESSKFGFPPDRLRAQCEDLLRLDRIVIDGLMCIPPLVPKAEDARRYFIALRELRERLAKELDLRLPHLSMGMSGDYTVAIEEGATIVRIGTAIFGGRSGKTWRPTEA